jgi:hypothetical protein
MMPPAAGEVPEEKVQKHFDPGILFVFSTRLA